MVLERFPEIMWHQFDLPPTRPPPPPWDSRGPDRTLKLPQQTALFTIPAPLRSLHPPQSSDCFRHACVHCLQLLWRQEHWVVAHLVGPRMCCSVHVCVSLLPERFHTHTPRQETERALNTQFPRQINYFHTSQTAANSSGPPQCHYQTQHWFFFFF